MTAGPTPEAWAQIRYEYEHTDKPLDDTCRDHRVSASTLHERVRRWGWTPRRRRIPAEGPPALRRPVEAAAFAPIAPAAALGESAEADAPPAARGEAPPPDPA